MNLGRLLSDIARRRPDDIGLVHGEETITWGTLDGRVNALVQGMKELGLTKGDRILLAGGNTPSWVEAFWAILKLGSFVVPVNPRLSVPEMAYLCGHSGSKAIVYTAGYEEHVDAMRAEAASVTHVIALDGPRDGEIAHTDLIEKHLGAAPWEAEVTRDDPCWLFYTSGTTGRPKATILTHGQMGFVVTNHAADLMPGVGPDDASLVVAPLSHGAGVHMLPNTARGAKSILPATPRFDPGDCLKLIEKWRVTNMFTVPTIVKMLVEHPLIDEVDHSSLKHVIYAGAPMYRADQKHALEKLGKVLVQYYGLGEVTGNITVLPAREHHIDDDHPDFRPGSCGYPRLAMEIAIKDADGTRLGPDARGEICVRGPAVFAGYYNNREATAKALIDGWFHTGDLGYLDRQGYLYITGRASDMYISGGSNVYPRDAEEVLLTHPAVNEIAILGVADPKMGESGVAVVVLERGRSTDEAELLGYLDGRLAKYKWPRRIFFWSELPKSGYGKVPKHQIRKELFARGELVEGEGV
ncbi:MAG: acyl-CoA synthetase [Alphaproteobacteria bacterium]|nr:acyl-CoA synthetase [Alphaproteobacteria bacterium]